MHTAICCVAESFEMELPREINVPGNISHIFSKVECDLTYDLRCILSETLSSGGVLICLLLKACKGLLEVCNVF